MSLSLVEGFGLPTNNCSALGSGPKGLVYDSCVPRLVEGVPLSTSLKQPPNKCQQLSLRERQQRQQRQQQQELLLPALFFQHIMEVVEHPLIDPLP